MAKLYDILGTKDAKEQARRVERLLQQAQAPVIDLILRYDPRTDEFTMQWFGVDRVPINVLKMILDQAQQTIAEKEIRAKLQQEQAAQTPLPIPDTGETGDPPSSD